jgi:hypothetical protein
LAVGTAADAHPAKGSETPSKHGKCSPSGTRPLERARNSECSPSGTRLAEPASKLTWNEVSETGGFLLSKSVRLEIETELLQKS